jgi:hypothetical protein
MHVRDLPPQALCTPPDAATEPDAAADLLAPLLNAPAAAAGAAPAAAAGFGAGVVVGELLALQEGAVALVRYAGQPGTQALRAASTVDLHGAHIGGAVVLAFERGDPQRPIVLGVVQGSAPWPLPDRPAQVQVDADGQRLVVQAREQLVLRCGKASITLTKAGKVLIEGTYLLSRSSGVNRVKGGSVQLN